MAGRLEDLKKQRAQLETALYSGTQSLKHGDKQIIYKTTADIRRALDDLDEQIAKLEGRGKIKIFNLYPSRGLRG
ncbi:phage head-tail joining protein [Bartonella sp. DGB2]|uniref:phage head-tail joining protein n=1 Tax=Bartonella sp. DGB2 TaxID=3388426 RepID=UPI00399007BE